MLLPSSPPSCFSFLGFTTTSDLQTLLASRLACWRAALYSSVNTASVMLYLTSAYQCEGNPLCDAGLL